MGWGTITGRGVVERRFDVVVDDQTVPGLLWLPEDAHAPRPLVLIGHGGSQHKRSPNILALARRLVRHLGFAAAAIDGPMHGERIEGGLDQTLDDVRRRTADRSPEQARQTSRQARDEWKATLDALQTVEGVGVGPVGYWGLSMGTIFGLPFVASEPRIDAAVLGLMGIDPDSPARSARSIEIPVLFLVDIIAPLERSPIGFDMRDLELDIVVAEDLSSWQLKDEDALDIRVQFGLHARAEADEIHGIGRDVVKLI